ncbi:hypothetical protein [Paraflavitalea speifideaquila]|uniref:hypothetical protein n=1 Tax=Paraflavitalea speifideaquila TaxID=3076558 RepID=UPI0028F168E0|nr:hypothetical protein [Paraflavitalea speifideiaquila]
MNYANELLNKGQLAQTQDVLNKAEPIVLKLENTAYAQYYFYMKGDLDLRKKDFGSAIISLKKSLQLAEVDNDAHQVSGAMSLLFDCYNAINMLPEARIYLDSTLLLAEEAGLKMRRKEVYDGFAVWYEKKGITEIQTFILKRP